MSGMDGDVGEAGKDAIPAPFVPGPPGPEGDDGPKGPEGTMLYWVIVSNIYFQDPKVCLASRAQLDRLDLEEERAETGWVVKFTKLEQLEYGIAGRMIQ